MQKCALLFFFCFHTHHLLSSFWTSSGYRCRPLSPRFLPSIFLAHRVQQSHCSSIFHRMLLTHSLALSASQFVPKKKSPRIYTSMHAGGFELTKLTYTLFRTGAKIIADLHGFRQKNVMSSELATWTNSPTITLEKWKTTPESSRNTTRGVLTGLQKKWCFWPSR